MFKIFTHLADWLSFSVFGLSAQSNLGQSVHFFIEDTTKIFTLLFVMIYVIALLRATLNVEAVRDFLAGKHRFAGYMAASVFGAITPFCSCSSIPLFLGFTQARIPIGITMSFLITSPMINEVAIMLMGGLLGLKFTIAYIGVGIAAGIAGGAFFDAIGAEKYLTPLVGQVKNTAPANSTEHAPQHQKMTLRQRHEFAKEELTTILSRIWKWVFIGIGAGAALHGFVPESFIIDTVGPGQWWSVPGVVVLGIPLYTNASGIIPVAESLLAKGLPVGTTLAFMMSVVAASFPEFMMLKQVMRPRLLLVFFMLLLVLFTLTGWIFNLVF